MKYMVNQKLQEGLFLDKEISNLANMEVVPGLKIKNIFVGDFELLANLRGLSGNSGKHPFIDKTVTKTTEISLNQKESHANQD